MSIHFNADEIFAIAEKIEVNGAAFYRKAAELFSKDQVTKFMLLDLAAKEDEHNTTFAQMRKTLYEMEKENTVFDPENQVIDYLNAIADKNVFDVKKDPTEILKGKESIGEVLGLAIGMEKDSIIFYLGLKDLISERKGRNKIDDIINEEKGHIVILSQKLNALKTA